MGGGYSAPAPRRVVKDPYPSPTATNGVSLSQAVKCSGCQLSVDTKITSANVKLQREEGDITLSQCMSYTNDKERVKSDTLSLTSFLTKLRAGDYARWVSAQDGVDYCEIVGISDTDAAAIKTISEVDAKVVRGRIAKGSGLGGFSSDTKARFIPSIPFSMSFGANKASGGKARTPVSETFPVTQLMLYYPSPIRIDSVQADAVLALNDPSDPAAKYIVLIPLRATNRGEPSADFISRIARGVPSIQTINPATNSYLTTDIQTGADWSISKLFTLSNDEEKGGLSKIKNGFFTWTGVVGYELYLAETTATTIRYGWKPKEGAVAPQYILLDSPLDISSTDLALLTQSLPMTPPGESVHPIPSQSIAVVHKDAEAPAPDSISGRTGCGLGNLCEGFGNPIGTEAFCEGAKCDPFFQNANRVNTSPVATIIPILFQMMIALSMIAGAYIAMTLIVRNYDTTLKTSSEEAGQVLSVWAKEAAARMPTKGSLLSMATSKFLPPGISKLASQGQGLAGLASQGPKGLADLASQGPKGLADLASQGPKGLAGLTSQGSAGLAELNAKAMAPLNLASSLKSTPLAKGLSSKASDVASLKRQLAAL